MAKVFKERDIFGAGNELTINGKQTFKTNLGLVFSCCTFAIISLFTYFFGMDFWYKTNPNVLTSVNFPKERKFIYPTTDKYTFMLRITDKAFNTVLDHPYKINASYTEYFFNEKTQKNDWRFVSYLMKKCSDTLAVKNPTLTDKNLQDWLCLEWEKVEELVLEKYKDTLKEYKPFLGGQVGDENYSIIYFAVANSFYDYKTK